MKNGIEIFDFREEDELPEYAASECLSKFEKPKIDDSALLKYEFLVARSSDMQRKEVNGVPCLDSDTIDCGPNCDAVAPFVPPSAGEGGFSLDGGSGLHISEESLPWRSQPGSAHSDSPSSYKSVDVASDANESMSNNSPSSPALDEAENDVSLEGSLSDHCVGNVVLDNENKAVNIYPDYVSYRGNYWTGSLVIFSDGGIKIESSTACDGEESFKFERGIDDIVKIVFQWSRAGYILVKLQVLSKDVPEGEDYGGASGIEEVVFSVYEPNWSEKREAITSLNIKYVAICDGVLDQEEGMDENNLSSHKCYFPNFDEPFEEVIYPKGDSDAVSISKRDVDLLQPETFINDTIIDFYIKYLKNQFPPEERQRFHFFNSFFFRKLADLDKDSSSNVDGRAAFLRVQKWTRKVDLFGKDYIFIPVNFNLHWSLIVICHPGEVALTLDEDIKKSPKVPCILHMDSIRGSHAGLKDLVQSYLWEEWKGRHKETSEDLSSRFLNLRFVSLELPQQDNSYDCGLFLLHYLELFLAEAPVNFNPFKITKWSNFLTLDWFLPLEASHKRTVIQRLIFELLEIRQKEIMSTGCNDESTEFPDTNETETGFEFLPQSCTPEMACDGNLPNSQADERIEMTSLGTSSMRKLNCDNDSGMMIGEFFEPGSLLERFPSFGQSSSYYHLNGAVSPREQDAVGGAEFVYNYQQITGTGEQDCASQYSSRGLMNDDASWKPGISIREHSIDTSPETSCASDDDDIVIIETRPDMAMELCEKDQKNQQRSPLLETVQCETEGLASASGELATISLSLSEENPAILPQQDNSGMVNQLAPDSLKDLMVSMHCAEASEDANGRQYGNEDGDLRPSEENPTKLLREVNQLGPDSETVVLARAIETSEDACLVQNSHEADPSEENKAAENKRDGLITSSDEQKPTKRPLESLHEGTLEVQNPITTENKQAICNDMQIIEDGRLAESDEQQPTKKVRLMSPDRGKVDVSEL